MGITSEKNPHPVPSKTPSSAPRAWQSMGISDQWMIGLKTALCSTMPVLKGRAEPSAGRRVQQWGPRPGLCCRSLPCYWCPTTIGNSISSPVTQFAIVKKWSLFVLTKEIHMKIRLQGRQSLQCWETGKCLRNMLRVYELRHLRYWFTGSEFWEFSVAGKWKEGSR